MNSQTTPLFSIIVPTYNEESFIAACIVHAKQQVCDFSYEIIVVDNNSTDGSAHMAQDLGVNVIHEKKQGVGAARRTGTAHARGYYITHIDADTHLPPQYLQDVLRRFEHHKNLACVGGQIYYYDASVWKNILRIPVHWGLWFFARVVSFGHVGPMGNNMTFQKEMYDQTSGFDLELKYGEDMDLMRKLSRYGKIWLDMSLKCDVSVRRFRFDKKLFVYALNFFKMCITGKTHKNELARHE